MPGADRRPEYVITVAGHRALPSCARVQVACDSPEWPRLLQEAIRRGLGVVAGIPGDERGGSLCRSQVVLPEGYFRQHAGEGGDDKARVTVIAEQTSPGQFLAICRSLLSHGAAYLFTPASAGDGTMPIVAASLGVPVKLAFSEEWSEAVLQGVLDYFLHSPCLMVPIEPFYSLAKAIGELTRAVMPTYFGEVLGRHYFVDGHGKVTLSERWADRGEFFGSLQNEVEWRHSQLWTSLENRAAETFISQTPCAFCEHYPYCDGLWTSACHGRECCRIWRGLMDRVAAAHREEVAATQEQTHA